MLSARCETIVLRTNEADSAKGQPRRESLEVRSHGRKNLADRQDAGDQAAPQTNVLHALN